MKILNKKRKIGVLIAFYIIFSLVFHVVSIATVNTSIEETDKGNIPLSADITGSDQWLDNPGFSSQQPWYSSEQGDDSDVNAIISDGVAKFEVLGNKTEHTIISGPINSSTSPGWKEFNNTDYPVLPNIEHRIIPGIGCSVSHYWDQQADQNGNYPSVLWKTNITMPVDMSDYYIINSSLEVKFNATVTATGQDEIEREGDSDPKYYVSGDKALFYILISDYEKSYPAVPIANYETFYLGDNDPYTPNITDGYITPYPEKLINDYLTSVFEVNPYNFTITLGVDIRCEDNYQGYDKDMWDSLLIKSINLTIIYEKKVDESASVSWNQDGDRLSDLSPEIDTTVVAQSANLNFKYKIDKNWTTTTSSQNSEINIYLNGNPYLIPIKLTNVNTAFEQANIGLTPPTDSVNLSIEVLLKDTFGLDQPVTISIDDVELWISYIIFNITLSVPSGGDGGGGGTTIIRGEDYTPVVIGLVAGIIGLVAVFGAYQAYFKHPPMVRKIRKLRKKIKKGKTIKSLIVKNRENIINSDFQKQMDILEVGVVSSKKISKDDKISKVSNDKELQKGGK